MNKISLIGLSGKKQHGKSTVGGIIQYLTTPEGSNTFTLNNYLTDKSAYLYAGNNWKVKQFAGKLKQIASLLTGCSISDLENEEFKNTYLKNEWLDVNYGTEAYDDSFHNISTYRELLQNLGTESLRNRIHENVHINALFSDYKLETINKPFYNYTGTPAGEAKIHIYPNWILTDCRFKNEVFAIKKRNGIVVRVENPRIVSTDAHASETELDNEKFDYLVLNDGSIEDLVIKVKDMLNHFNIL